MGMEKKSKKRLQTPAKRRSPSKFNRNYFTLPHPFWIVVIPCGIMLLVQATFKPHNLPDFLGPVGTFASYMGTQHNTICVLLCVFCVVAHSGEAAYAGKLCHEMLFGFVVIQAAAAIFTDRGMTTSATIKWVGSTFCFGFPSLILRLIPYKPDYKIV